MRATIYLNGKLVGFHSNPDEFVKKFREMRRNNQISSEVNISYRKATNEIFINTSESRLRRPYLVVENGKIKLNNDILEKLKKKQLTWNHLVKMGIIEYLDADEEDNAYIAKSINELTKEHTHLEIDPSTIFGIVAGILPYPEYNSSPRITMASSMAKQSLGLYASNFNFRYDTKSYVMYYPQQPIVQTSQYRILDLKKRSAGQNFVVAVATYKGWNIFDALVINKSAVDRGLGRVMMFKTYEGKEVSYPSQQKDVIEIPSPKVSGYRGDEYYVHLDEDGVVIPETEVKEKDVLIGRTSPPRFFEEVSIFGAVEEKKRENSITVKGGDKGKVDSVLIAESISGNKLIKVRLRLPKIPEIGDKFASRHGQKGVIGLLVNHEDMPFTESGIVPDLIINPHAIPSRMTAGHLLEMLGGKAGAITGEIMDGTAFRGDKAEKFIRILKEHGFDEWGEETMYDGITGEKITVKIFVGVIYYQRLHHLVSNKIHARSKGPVQLLTLQPTEGRSREGGLRFGEMERDTLIGHGVAAVIKDRLLDESDKSIQYICKKCGSIVYKDYIKNEVICPLCNSKEIVEVEIPYAFKLLADEINSLMIFPRIITDKRINKKGDL